MPEPDLPPLVLEGPWLDAIRADMPELPQAKRERYLALGVRAEDAELIAFDVATAAFFDAAAGAYRGATPGGPQRVANWLIGDVAGLLNERGRTLSEVALRPDALAAMVGRIDEGAISGKIAKEILPDVVDGEDPDAVVARRGLTQITDERALAELVERVMDAHPEVVASAREHPKAINALLGRVMKESRGAARPDAVRRLLRERLGLPAAD
jgi:aspartyl-tRNA(Asn)/glutamyl-tRNA(Gln) amidotransferase subunit B